MRSKILFTLFFSFSMFFTSVFAANESAASNFSNMQVQQDDIFDIYKAYDRAQKLNRPVFYVVASAGCSHCYAYLNNTIKPNFELINRDFVFAMSDISKGDKVPSNIPFNGTTPTTYIISPTGQLMTPPIEGNFNQEYLQTLIQKLYEAYGLR